VDRNLFPTSKAPARLASLHADASAPEAGRFRVLRRTGRIRDDDGQRLAQLSEPNPARAASRDLDTENLREQNATTFDRTVRTV
jgi:hypothetical protein